MPSFHGFSLSLHEASIAGKVVDAVTGRALEGVLVSLDLPTPPAFQARLSAWAVEHGARWGTLEDRPDRTKTARDGTFRFVDLPAGVYVVGFQIPGDEGRHGVATKTLSVPGLVTHDSAGNLVLTAAVIPLPPTGGRGQVWSGDGSSSPLPLPMARVRVRGTGELAYGDADGHFYLPYLEPGHRLIEITASGHEAATAAMLVTRGQVTDVGSIVLVPLPL